MGRSIAATVLLASSLVVTTAKSAFACSCVLPGSDAKALEGADAVFVGSVTGHSDPRGDQLIIGTGDPITWMFDVEAVAKGQVDRFQNIHSARDESSCGFVFSEGSRYLVFAYRGADPIQGEPHPETDSLNTHLCTKTRELSRGEALSFPLRPVSSDPVPPPEPREEREPGIDGSPDEGILSPGITGGALLVTALAVGLYLLGRRVGSQS